MGSELSLKSRAEVTKRYATSYLKAPRKTKTLILDQVVDVTGWSRANARRRLTGKATQARHTRRKPGPKPGSRRYSYDTVKVLQQVWAVSGGQCGKYLAASMSLLLDNLQAHGNLVPGQDRYSLVVRSELETMSGATIDRYLKPIKDKDPLRGKTATRPGSMLRNSITVRKATDEVEDEPGFFEMDTVAHCGPTLKGEFARSVNLTDMHTGWVFTIAIRNNARVHMLAALDAAQRAIPYQIQALDCDNGSEFINHDVVGWASTRDIYFTRSRPNKKNDQATIESKNGHLVRRYGMYWRYDTATEREILKRLWRLVNDRLNYFTPTKKPVGWSTDSVGRRKRLYDAPATPLDRLLASDTLAPTQITELQTRRDQLDVADLARQINQCQRQLIKLAAAKTRALEKATRPKLPDPKGIKPSHN
ncbi:MAG: transposase family protein [Micrococcales bacterium]|nr:transposase family protein [Micrococcales bacterium]